MTMNRSARLPAVPTLPKGETIATYETYLEAQRAVDHLSDKEFAVENVTIVGTDLRMVERVTGRLTYSRVALAGLASGAWFGLVIGLLFWAVGTSQVPPILPAVAIGAAAGIIFSVISYSFTGGKRDFTSSSQIVASRYAVLCVGEHAHRARALLTEAGGPGIGRPGAAGAAGPVEGPPTAQPVPQQPQPHVPQQPPVPPQSHVPPPHGEAGPRP